MKSFEADELAQAFKTIAELEAVKPTSALFNREEPVVNKKLILLIVSELGIKGLPGRERRPNNLMNRATEEDLVQPNYGWTGPTCCG